MAGLRETMEEAAGRFREVFVVGVRPLGGGWFASAGDIEYDGGSPMVAVNQVVDGLYRREEDRARAAGAQLAQAEARLTGRSVTSP
jgi:hypothetical protein